ncbi:MAG: Trk family potassium uptake protein [Clostridia bacterium]|nr:Trk family potassium uptake protein [Clostridia bacterium]
MKKRLTGGQVIAIGFFAIILLGTLLLCLPIATKSGEPASFFEALFTATSATCVTGLVVQDTALYWSYFGQAVILLLIQVGGMGFITISTLLLMLLRKKVGIRNREQMVESISTADTGSILPLTKKIFVGTAAVELTGACLLAIRFIPQFGVKGIWYSLFHSVSAFCNAGFDLMGPVSGPYSSLTAYAADPLVVLTVVGLITIGGLGYWVWEDLWRNRWHWRKWRLHTKLVVTLSLVLTLGGALLFWFLERGNRQNFPPAEQALRALFDAVTPRTAGFNTSDTAALTEGSKLLTVVYMFIGGSSGSTAGGIKTTTFLVLLLFTVTEITRRRDTYVFGRRLDNAYLHRAVSVATTNLLLALFATLVIAHTLPSVLLSDIFIETFSAIGTVGMSTGLTRQLSVGPQAVLIFLMFCGRVGSLSFSTALLEKRSHPPVTHPTEQIIVG